MYPFNLIYAILYSYMGGVIIMWKAKSKKEQWIATVIIWIAGSIVFGLTGESDTIATLMGVICISLTIYVWVATSNDFTSKPKITKNTIQSEEFQKDRDDFKQTKKLNRVAKISQKRGKELGTGQLCCPKCGCTQLSSNKKGFTFWTGIIGSKKVFITCMQCGKRWKAGKYR